MIVNTSTILPCNAEQAVMHAKTPLLHQYVTTPLLRFVPIEPPILPNQDKYLVGAIGTTPEPAKFVHIPILTNLLFK